MMRFEPDVRVGVLAEPIARVLVLASVWSTTADVDVVVRSMNDGREHHAPTSLHYFDLAVDLGTEPGTKRDLYAFTSWLRRHLPHGFTIRLEADYVHVEWDTGRDRDGIPRLP